MPMPFHQPQVPVQHGGPQATNSVAGYGCHFIACAYANAHANAVAHGKCPTAAVGICSKSTTPSNATAGDNAPGPELEFPTSDGPPYAASVG